MSTVAQVRQLLEYVCFVPWYGVVRISIIVFDVYNPMYIIQADDDALEPFATVTRLRPETKYYLHANCE